MSKFYINKLVITNSLINSKTLKKVLKLKLNGVKVMTYNSFNEEIQGKVDVKSIDENWFLSGSGFTILHNTLQKRIKRLFDIILGILIALLTMPIMILSAVAIKLESPGEVLFKERRVGFGGREFTIIKFRSMRNDAEKDGAKWAEKNIPRVTKFGNFMRKTKIDELPQLWNVLNGDMSFIEPRPERQVFIDTVEKEIPFYNLGYSVQPGLTGWAQVM
ncbi:sugar transferase [uncultured Ilyobacter sp.]|uniref:sugar transferase n=1 Tax=uncultured Ilyobacter sp. TaxID=544433 RepID=UPI0029C08C09|nr:sugar transferase [uncultured Ilyobacter sp.]